jgi:hypothetical protein
MGLGLGLARCWRCPAMRRRPAGRPGPAAGGKLTVEESGRLLATGRAAYEDGLYRLARRRLEELVAGAPDRRRQAEGALWLARVLLAERRPGRGAGGAGGPRRPGAGGGAGRRITPWRGRRPGLNWAGCRRPWPNWRGSRTGIAWRRRRPMRAASAAATQAPRRMGNRPRGVRAAGGAASGASRRAGGLAGFGRSAGGGRPARRGARRAGACRSRLSRQVWSERAALKLVELQLAQGERPQAMKLLRTLAANTNLLAETRAHGYRIVAQALGAESNYPAALEIIERGMAPRRTGCSAWRARW